MRQYITVASVRLPSRPVVAMASFLLCYPPPLYGKRCQNYEQRCALFYDTVRPPRG